MNTTELIIKSVVNGGHWVEFSPAPNGDIYISINGARMIFHDFEQLNEIFIAHYLTLGIESEKRIDGGCIAFWHKLKEKKLFKNLARKCLDCGENLCDSPWHVLPWESKGTDCPECGDVAIQSNWGK
jgi:hypothetical protein